MADTLQKMVTADRQAVIVAADATSLVQDTMSRLEAWPPAMFHLGHSLLAALLMQVLPDRNVDERIELQWRTDGPFGILFSECRGLGRARGIISEPRPEVFDLKASLGTGLLQVRRTPSQEGHSVHMPSLLPTTGIVEARGDVTLDVLDYLERSEQKNCAMDLWVNIKWRDEKGEEHSSFSAADHPTKSQPFQIVKAYGYLVHVLPQKTESQTNDRLFQWDHYLRSLGPISSWVLKDDPTLEILSIISGEFTPKVLVKSPVEFFCTCSDDRAARALALADSLETGSLGEIPADSVDLSEDSIVKCEFCGRSYLISKRVSKMQDKLKNTIKDS